MYEVRVLVNNFIGYGKVSGSFIIKLDEEKLLGLFIEVNVKVIGSEFFRILWMVGNI